jgi:hypothetical protein
MTFFNCYLRLNNILSVGLKMLVREFTPKFFVFSVLSHPLHLFMFWTSSFSQVSNTYVRLARMNSPPLIPQYGLNKSKKLLAYRDPAWAEHIVDEIDSALNIWLDSIPPHRPCISFRFCGSGIDGLLFSLHRKVRLEPNRQNDAFFDQSVLLYCSYYRVQMTIHRPFIPVMREGEPTVSGYCPPSSIIVSVVRRSLNCAVLAVVGDLYQRRALVQPCCRYIAAP